VEKCYEYFACAKTDCVMYSDSNSKNCWEIEGTLCNSPSVGTIKDLLESKDRNKCHYCIYRTEALFQNNISVRANRKYQKLQIVLSKRLS